MEMDHVIVDGSKWDELAIPLNHRLDWSGFRTRLTLNIQPGDHYSTDWMEDTGLFECNSRITLNLGWGTTPQYPYDGSKAHSTICDLLPLFFVSFRFNITICPYVDPKAEESLKHKWCLPKKIPVIANRYIMRHYYPKIRFQSSCDCGNGDNTGCE